MASDLLAPAAGIGWLCGMVGVLPNGRRVLHDGTHCVPLPGDGAVPLNVDLTAHGLRPDESHAGTLALVVSQCEEAVEDARWAASDAEQFSLPPIPEAAAVASAWLAVCEAVCDHHQCSPEHIAAVRALVAAVVDWRAR